MSDKKNIDRLFQEKFKDFEVTPPEMVWENIETELREKKERRALPLWFKLSGVAALFIIGLLVMFPLINEGGGAYPVVIHDNNNIQGSKGPARITPVEYPVKQHGAVTDAGNTGNSKSEPLIGRPDANNALPGNKSVKNKAAQYNRTGKENNAVAYGNANKNKVSKINIIPGNNKKGKVNDGIVYDTHDRNIKKGKGSNAEKAGASSQTVAAHITGKHKVNTIAANDFTSKLNSANNAKTGPGGNSNIAVANNSGIAVNGGTNGTTLTDIPFPETPAYAEVQTDTTSIVPEENALEKLLKEKELEKKTAKSAVAEAIMDKWRIKPQMAPVFYSSISDGSPIDSQFASNSKDYNKDLSYGIGINYAVSNRLSVRSGVNTVNLGYRTNGIEFYAALNDQTNNVSSKSKARTANIVVQNQGAGPSTTGFTTDQLPTQKFNGSMQQNMGYIEVPVEMSYKLLDTRFGIDIIGGVSTLFLNENNISVVSSQGYSSNIGEAENLNNVHFSTNVGLGFKYRFLKSFEANFEPMFKYQVNTFSNDSGNFKPYFIGLYSGVSFSF